MVGRARSGRRLGIAELSAAGARRTAGLTVDHGVAGGAAGARLLTTLQELL